MPSKKSDFEKLAVELFSLTEDYWQVGAVCSLIGTIVTIAALSWVANFNLSQLESSILVTPIIEKYGMCLYALPVSLGFITFLFARQTFVSYKKSTYPFHY